MLVNTAFEHCSWADRISPRLLNSAQHNVLDHIRTKNKCCLLGIVMGITVESQTVAALVKVSKYNLKSAFDRCSRPDRISAKGMTKVQHDFLDHTRPLK